MRIGRIVREVEVLPVEEPSTTPEPEPAEPAPSEPTNP